MMSWQNMAFEQKNIKMAFYDNVICPSHSLNINILLAFYCAFSLPKLISFKHKIKYTFHSLLCVLVHWIIFWCLNICTVLNLLSFLALFVSLQCVSDKSILLRVPFFRYEIMLFWLKSLYHLCSQWCCQLRHLVLFLISILTNNIPYNFPLYPLIRKKISVL